MAQYGLFSPYEVMNFCLHSIYSFYFITVSSGRFTQGFTVSILILFTLKTSGDSDQLTSTQANLDLLSTMIFTFVLFDFLHPSQQFFSHAGMGLPGFNQ